jgi:hypothetical protein
MVNNLTFSEAVRRICNIHGDVEAKTFTRVATAATVAMKQLRLHVMPLIKTERGTLDASLSWKFPADFSIFTKSGLLCDDGSIKIFGQSNAIDQRQGPPAPAHAMAIKWRLLRVQHVHFTMSWTPLLASIPT